jgi:hypothetical protein
VDVFYGGTVGEGIGKIEGVRAVEIAAGIGSD